MFNFFKKKETTEKKLIDVVKKISSSSLGPFGNMCEDVRQSADHFRGSPILFASAGYALIFGACATYVAGRVAPKIITDYTESGIILMEGLPPEQHEACIENAIVLSNTYVSGVTREIYDVIIDVAKRLEVLSDSYDERITHAEVVARANQIVKNQSITSERNPNETEINFMRQAIENNGIDHVVNVVFLMIAPRLTSREIAYQFVLEELEGASIGNDASRVFALTSGISQHEYKNASDNSLEELDGPQQQLLELTFQLAYDRELMAAFRCKLAENIMQHFNFGKYSDSNERINDLLEKLRDILFSDQNVTSALTTRFSAPKNAPIRHIHFTNKNIEAAKDIIGILREFADKDDDSIIRMALEGSDFPLG
ncbi:MAG: hypothetical protein ABTQ26_13385 [Azonexus sp.]